MIPVNQPLFAKNTQKYVSQCIETGWISSAGEFIQRFEHDFSHFLKVKYAVTTTSGTTALHLALISLGIGPDDAVFIPDLTMIAVPYAVLYTGASPVPIDVDPETYNINPLKIREYLTSQCRYDPKQKAHIDKCTHKTFKAILPVHLYGHPCDMDAIKAIAEEYGLLVIEDAAEAHGAMLFKEGDKEKGMYAGAIGDVGCFSFYANKIITTGEGGMVVTNSEKIASKARRFKDLAHSPEKRFFHTDLAYNYRMTNLQAAVGTAQMEEIDRFISIKRSMAQAYSSSLQNVRGLTLPIEKEWARSVYWMYALLVQEDFGISRDELMSALKKKGIDTRSFFIPVHKQPAIQKLQETQQRSFPESNQLSQKGLYLPSGLALTPSQIQEVCLAIKDIQKNL
ncbi:MAG: DegT/DnrJ/EryC1/StrS family aminotransferase [Candidatus Aminicenantes bacterium]|nr:DegT/DnrJ/EryC1/StrS family aminotransferase [Candidatus Aminicenantes bacterium]